MEAAGKTAGREISPTLPLPIMKSLSFRQKLWLPIALCWVALLAVTVINAFQARAEQLDARKQTLADVTEMAYTIVADYAHRAETGELSTDEAKKQAIALPDDRPE